jgi:purine-binding chemotaxis protein CheW
MAGILMGASHAQAVEPARSPAPLTETSGSSQFVTFICAGEEFGVEILRVQEIRGWDRVTPVPYSPAYVLGIMNLRGVIVPIIDLRSRLNIERAAYGASTVVIVVRVRSRTGEKTAGLVVDAVSEVYSVAGAAITPTPALGNTAERACVSGVAAVEGKLILLLDIDALLEACVESEDHPT